MYDDDDYDQQGQDSNIVVPSGSVRTSKIRDRAGKQTVRESIVLKLRACTKCKLVMNEDQFLAEGCINCPDLELDNNRDAVWTHTTTHFKGLAVVLRPDISWVARYNNLSGLKRGAYAVSLSAADQSNY